MFSPRLFLLFSPRLNIVFFCKLRLNIVNSSFNIKVIIKGGSENMHEKMTLKYQNI